MTRRAVASFNAQEYTRKHLEILDTSAIGHPFRLSPIGHLRNVVNAKAEGEIIVHWDSDDVSHPRRITEQVTHLIESGSDAVGYYECLFWDQAKQEAWMYNFGNALYGVGTSLCFWRTTWLRRKFGTATTEGNPRGIGEDLNWCLEVKTRGVSGMLGGEPRIIASIHGGNISSRIEPEKPEWKRAAQWDSYCESHMRLL
jgi:hypothetical protein